MTKATRWVWDHLDPVDDRIAKAQDKLAERSNKPFDRLRALWARPFARANTTLDDIERKADRVFDETKRKLPHPGARWALVRGRTTLSGRLKGGGEVAAIGSVRVVTWSVYAATRSVAWAGETGVRIGIWGTHLAGRVAIFGGRVVCVGGPWVAFSGARLGLGACGGLTTMVLETPSAVRRLSGVPQRIVHWIRHGENALASSRAKRNTAPEREVDLVGQPAAAAPVVSIDVTSKVAAKPARKVATKARTGVKAPADKTIS